MHTTEKYKVWYTLKIKKTKSLNTIFGLLLEFWQIKKIIVFLYILLTHFHQSASLIICPSFLEQSNYIILDWKEYY